MAQDVAESGQRRGEGARAAVKEEGDGESGVPGQEMSSGNLATKLSAHCSDAERRLLVGVDDGQMTYGELGRASDAVAASLVALGLSPGQRVSVQVEKSTDNLVLYLGVLKAGLVYHPLNTAYTLSETRFLLEQAAPSAIVCDPAAEAGLRSLCAEIGVVHFVTLGEDGSGTFQAQLAKPAKPFEDHFEIVARKLEDPAVLLYSSGTTGQPKGIPLSHGNLIANAEVLVRVWGFTQADVLLHALPLYHAHGLFVALHCVLLAGASMVWLKAFEARSVQQALPGCTVMMGVPTYYTRLLAEPRFGAGDCASMRVFISGSAPLLPETYRRFEDRTGHRILERYGMSETGMNASNPLYGERKCGTVGLPLPETEIRICNSQHELLGTGQVGEIEVRGPNVFSSYWGTQEAATQGFTTDGWFVTGDQGRFDDDGYLEIVGRSKDMVITGGLNVYPGEVEAILNTLPGVLESAVFGVPHADFGEAVVAIVVQEPGAAPNSVTLRRLTAGYLAGFKVPKAIVVHSALPRNAMGKVQKDLLRREWSWPAEDG